MDTSPTGASLKGPAEGGDVAVFTVEPKTIEEPYPPIFTNDSKTIEEAIDALGEEFELIDAVPQEPAAVDKTIEEMFVISRVFIPVANAQEPRLAPSRSC